MVPGMSKFLLKKSFTAFAAFAVVCTAFFGVVACTQDSDGPIPLTPDGESFEGDGFFRKAVLDSGAFIHLVSDTLYLDIDSLWTFSNCALQSIEIEESVEDESFVLSPVISLKSDGEDCPSPYNHPDTTMKILLDKDKVSGLSVLRVRNDEGRVLDTILLRRGKFELDTISIKVDSLFDSVSALPLRTKGSPSILKVLDSLTPRVFYWRPMKSECTLPVDVCGEVRNDTIFPTTWRTGDTALVPIHTACADTDSVYCSETRWKNDSSSVGDVQEHADTLWHTSIYYIEKIPECATMNSFVHDAYGVGKNMKFVRELMVPDDSETACGPSPLREAFIYDLGRNQIFPDTLDADSLYKVWEKKAKVVK